MARIKEVSNREELENAIDDHISRGYRIQKKQESQAKMKLKDFGSLQMHILIFLLTAWWTFGIGNVLYAGLRYFTASSVIIKIDSTVKGSV